MEVLQTIALLCQIHTGNEYINSTLIWQLSCQQELIRCVDIKSPHVNYAPKLSECVLKLKR